MEAVSIVEGDWVISLSSSSRLMTLLPGGMEELEEPSSSSTLMTLLPGGKLGEPLCRGEYRE